MPTADQVARAIVAAARVFDVDPIDIASGGQAHGRRQAEMIRFSRARMYAGMALDLHFNADSITVSRTRIARWIGVTNKQSAESYFPSLEQRRRKGVLQWWQDGTVLEIVKAIATGEQKPMPTAQDDKAEPFKPRPLDAYTESKPKPKPAPYRPKLVIAPPKVGLSRRPTGPSVTARVLGDPDPEASALARRGPEIDAEEAFMRSPLKSIAIAGARPAKPEGDSEPDEAEAEE